MSQYYPPYRSSSNNIKVELDLANYATKTDLNNIIHVDVSSFASKTNLAALKTEVDKIDAADITKLKAIDTNSFVNKTKFSADINTLDDKIDGVEKKTLI